MKKATKVTLSQDILSQAASFFCQAENSAEREGAKVYHHSIRVNYSNQLMFNTFGSIRVEWEDYTHTSHRLETDSGLGLDGVFSLDPENLEDFEQMISEMNVYCEENEFDIQQIVYDIKKDIFIYKLYNNHIGLEVWEYKL